MSLSNAVLGYLTKIQHEHGIRPPLASEMANYHARVKTLIYCEGNKGKRN
jgi:hypothetical protein